MRKKILLFVAAFSLLLTSCVKEEMITEYGDQEALIVKASINGLDQEGVTQRSAVTAFSSSTIGIFVDDEGTGTAYTPATNSLATVTSGTNTATTDPVIFINEAAKVYAYYPAIANELTNPTKNSTKAITVVSSDNFSAAGQTDYLWANPASVSKSSRTADLTFNHALSKVIFSIKLASEYAGTGALTKIKLASANASYKFKTGTGTMAISSGTIASLTNQNTDSLVYTGSKALTTTASTAYALVAPATLAETTTSEITLSMTIDGQTYTCLLPVTSVSAWGAAYSYTYNITVNPGSLVVGTVSIADWTAGASTTVDVGTAYTIPLENESNSYILHPGHSIYIPVSRVVTAWTLINESTFTLPTTWTAGLLWTTNSNGLSASGSISAIDYNREDGYIKVSAGNAEGNSVIAAYDTDGTTILWSWHIWVTDEPATETVNTKVWMDRNLGATEIADGTSVTFATCGGLLYQWGRKDPFPGSNGLDYANMLPIYNTSAQLTSSETILPWPSGSTYIGTTPVKLYNISSVYANQCEYSIKYPLLFLQNWAGSTATTASAYSVVGGISSWGGENGESKSIFDPCPVGWRVPSGRVSGSEFSSPWSTWTTDQSITSSSYAALLWNISSNTFRYPVTGFRNPSNGALGNIGFSGHYWSASAYTDGGYGLSILQDAVDSSTGGSRAYGCSIRCVKE